MNQEKIGKFIAERRKEYGYLQKDLAVKLGVSEKTISKWECGNGLPEVVYMEPLCRILGITVNELLAGERIPLLDLVNLMEKSRLELVKQLEFEQLKMRIYKRYDIEIETMESSENGAGGLTYFVTAGSDRYVVKYPSENGMNHPEVEIKVCEELLKKGIPACRFLPNKQGNMISMDENGRQFTMQHYYEGITYGYHEAPVRLQKKAVGLLAKIHAAMSEMQDIPVGIGADFFTYRKPENMLRVYEKTLQQAEQKSDYGKREENGHYTVQVNDITDSEIASHIRSNMQIIENMPKFSFDSKRFTCGNTHGDFMISQMIWKENEISGIIDWTCACKHPYIWEIVRSYVFMAPEVKQGEIAIESLIAYISEYLCYGTLNSYDLENAGNLFFYFLAVCDFYGQYYESLSANRWIYLQQAEMASKLLLWFGKNLDQLNKRLKQLSQEVTYQKKMNNYYDEEGRLLQYPANKNIRILVLEKLAECFTYEKNYTEKEVNDIIRQNIAFSDVELIRREMFQLKFLGRLRDGAEYWRE